MSGKAGIEKHIDDAAERPPSPGEGDQAALPGFEPAQTAHAPGVEDPKPLDGQIETPRGRPPGSRNRKTAEMVRYLNTFGAGPLVGLAKVVNLVTPQGLPDIDKLHDLLGLPKDECARFWRDCAKELAPYMHQKLPIAVDVRRDDDGDLLVINMGAVQGDPETTFDQLPGHLAGDVEDAEIIEDESEENQ